MRRALTVAAGLAVCLFWSLPAHAGPRVGNISYIPTRDWAKAHGNQGKGANLFYHGGLVQPNTTVYIDFWGSDWTNTGFSQTDSTGNSYGYAQAMNYITTFFGGVGSTHWIEVDNQYCMSGSSVTVSTGSSTCPSGATFITNQSSALGATPWNDTTTPVPNQPSNSDILAEAQRAQSQFGNYSSNALYLVFTPSGKAAGGFGTSYCAWHSASGNLAYAYIPYQPDAGWECGANFIFPTDNSFGNGFFDGFSTVAGHEYAETQTDPYGTGWLDKNNQEVADKCEWDTTTSGSIRVQGKQFAVQSLWSNAISGCTMGS